MNIVKLIVAIIFVVLTSGCETLGLIKSDSSSDQSELKLKEDAAKKAAADQALRDAFRADALKSQNTPMERLAAQGNASAQYSLGREFEQGKIRQQNYSEAIKWYRLSAAQGNLEAQSALGEMYNEGRGVIKNQEEAARWWKLAAINSETTKQKNKEKLKIDQDYLELVRACIKVGVSFKPPISQTSNVYVRYQVILRPDGIPSKINLMRSSGNAEFDKQVSNGIFKCSPFPKMQTGKHPYSMNLIYYMYDRKL